MTDSILIVGAGVAGLHAAQICADAGARAIVVEREPVVGGRLAAAMSGKDGIGDRAEGTSVPTLESIAGHESIEVLTLASLATLKGRPGNFTAGIRERARFVTDACTECALCRAVCPVVLANEFDAGLSYRKAIYSPLPETLPSEWVVDIEHCLNTPPNYLPCNRCIEACEDDAIHFDMALETVTEHPVGAVVVASGFDLADDSGLEALGYGTHPDVVTSAELQRLLESPGPTGGYATRPSNEEYPDSVLLVLDAMSPFALYIVASQVNQLLAQDVGRVSLLLIAPAPKGDEYADAQRLIAAAGIDVRHGAMLEVAADDDGQLAVSFEDTSDRQFAREHWDMVVLCSDVRASEGAEVLASVIGTELDGGGYFPAEPGAGISVAGCAAGPINIKEALASAERAAAAALDCLDPRLLREDYASAEPQVSETSETPEASAEDDDKRRQIELALYALLENR